MTGKRLIAQFQEAKSRAAEVALNTASTAEWLRDFVATTIQAESRHFASLAVETITEKLTGFRQPNKANGAWRSKNDALEPLAGVRLQDDPFERLEA